MPHHVYAATTGGAVMEGWRRGVMISSTSKTLLICPFPLRSQGGLDFSERQTIHHIVSGEPALARDANAEPQILQTLSAMSVGVDHAFNTLLPG